MRASQVGPDASPDARSPYPHFGYTLALKHSPQLRNVPTLPRGGDDLGDGVSSL